jgi:putative ATP-binding cassette transporter
VPWASWSNPLWSHATMADPTTRKHTLELNRVNWQRFTRAVRGFLGSEAGAKAKGLFAILVGLLLVISGLNVLNSYVGRDFMTAIEDRNTNKFVSKTILYVCVFAFLTVAATIYRFAEERLGPLWREWLTRRMLQQYLGHRMYYQLNETGRIPTPDQRIAEDARAFAAMTLSLWLLLLNGIITVTAFSGVLWSISPILFGVAVGCAAAGSSLTVLLGRPLIHLNYTLADKEAFFRTDLVHIREHAERVALLHREGHMRVRLMRHLDSLIENSKRIITVNRNLGFFTTGYTYLIQIVPIVITAPLFIRGEVEFGVITQSAMAFAHLMGAFSLIVTQFQSLSSYAAVLARLSDFDEAAEEIPGPHVRAIEFREEKDRVAFERLTLRSRTLPLDCGGHQRLDPGRQRHGQGRPGAGAGRHVGARRGLHHPTGPGQLLRDAGTAVHGPRNAARADGARGTRAPRSGRAGAGGAP